MPSLRAVMMAVIACIAVPVSLSQHTQDDDADAFQDVAWVQVPGPGIVKFSIVNPHVDGTARVNGTKYRELSFGACACAEWFAMPVTRQGWISIDTPAGSIEHAAWVFGHRWSHAPFEKIHRCKTLERVWTTDTAASMLNWLVRPCSGSVSMDGVSLKCVGSMRVEAGVGSVLWRVCFPSDPFERDGYSAKLQFAVWLTPAESQAPELASGFASAGTVTTLNIAQDDAAQAQQEPVVSMFWSVQI